MNFKREVNVGVAAVGSSFVSLPKNPEIDPNVEQALEEIDGLATDIQKLQAMIEKGKATPAEIQELQDQIVQDATTLKSFMNAHPSSFTATEENIATALNSWAGNLSMLPPQDTADISYMIGGMMAFDQTLRALMWPTQ